MSPPPYVPQNDLCDAQHLCLGRKQGCPVVNPIFEVHQGNTVVSSLCINRMQPMAVLGQTLPPSSGLSCGQRVDMDASTNAPPHPLHKPPAHYSAFFSSPLTPPPPPALTLPCLGHRA